MSEEASTLVLDQLRAIGSKLDTLDKRFETQGKRWHETQRQLNQALGMGLSSQLALDQQGVRLSDLENQVKRIEELHTDLRRWVTQLDERS